MPDYEKKYKNLARYILNHLDRDCEEWAKGHSWGVWINDRMIKQICLDLNIENPVKGG